MGEGTNSRTTLDCTINYYTSIISSLVVVVNYLNKAQPTSTTLCIETKIVQCLIVVVTSMNDKLLQIKLNWTDLKIAVENSSSSIIVDLCIIVN